MEAADVEAAFEAPVEAAVEPAAVAVIVEPEVAIAATAATAAAAIAAVASSVVSAAFDQHETWVAVFAVESIDRSLQLEDLITSWFQQLEQTLVSMNHL